MALTATDIRTVTAQTVTARAAMARPQAPATDLITDRAQALPPMAPDRAAMDRVRAPGAMATARLRARGMTGMDRRRDQAQADQVQATTDHRRDRVQAATADRRLRVRVDRRRARLRRALFPRHRRRQGRDQAISDRLRDRRRIDDPHEGATRQDGNASCPHRPLHRTACGEGNKLLSSTDR